MLTREEVDSYIEKGKHGVTRHQMIPAINNNMDNHDVLVALYHYFPNTFKASIRYIKIKAKNIIIDIFGEDILKVSQEELALINKLQPKRKGVTMNQIIKAIEKAVNAGDFDLVAQIQKYFPEYYSNSVKYINKPVVEKIKAYAAALKARKATTNK